MIPLNIIYIYIYWWSKYNILQFDILKSKQYQIYEAKFSNNLITIPGKLPLSSTLNMLFQLLLI